VELADEARSRNDAARLAADAVLERGQELYGVTTGVGPLREYRLDDEERVSHQLRQIGRAHV